MASGTSSELGVHDNNTVLHAWKCTWSNPNLKHKFHSVAVRPWDMKHSCGTVGSLLSTTSRFRSIDERRNPNQMCKISYVVATYTTQNIRNIKIASRTIVQHYTTIFNSKITRKNLQYRAVVCQRLAFHMPPCCATSRDLVYYACTLPPFPIGHIRRVFCHATPLRLLL